MALAFTLQAEISTTTENNEHYYIPFSDFRPDT